MSLSVAARAQFQRTLFELYILVGFSMIFLQVLTVRAQFPASGPCPTKTPSNPIDIKLMTGQWYEIEATPTFLEYPFKCISIRVPPFYEKTSEISVDAVNRMTKKSDTIQKLVAKIPVTSNDQDGKLVLSMTPPSTSPEGELAFGPKLREMYEELPLQVLATDYNNWALVWMCQKHDKARAHIEFVWVLSRQPTLTPDQYKAVHEAKLKYRVELVKTRDTIQSGCSKEGSAEQDDEDKDKDNLEDQDD